MEKKYTVFVSSTYQDLIEERQEVMQALLEMDCIPCGMELFPAADDEQFEFIKSVIDECDYYVLILAGRYGSISKNGISYTELEFNYAMEKNIPILSFIYEDITKLTDDKREKDTATFAKLLNFHSLAKQRLCKFWSSKEQLSGLVSRSMIQLIKRHPAVGWVRAGVSSEDTLLKITELYEENRELRTLKGMNETAKTDYILADEDDTTNIEFSINEHGYSIESFFITMSWNEILKQIGPVLIEEQISYCVEKALLSIGRTAYINHLGDESKIKYFTEKQRIDISSASIGEILIQFMALEYIEVHHPNHNNDFETYHESTFVLTELGREALFKISAKRKE